MHVATKACGRLSKEIAPRASVVAKALALTSNDVSSEDKTHISYTGAAKRGASGGTGTLEDAGENMASDHNADNENEVDEDPLLKHDTIANEIVHEWVAYVETIEGRQLVNELGPENVRPHVHLLLWLILTICTGAPCVETRQSQKTYNQSCPH